MADVFISYAREDRDKAEHIARGLGALGLDSFWDTEIPPGQTWADYIEEKLSACKAVIVLWSEHSTKSQWVREEARMGREKSKLIPVMLDAAPPPFGFGEVQAADLSAWNGDYLMAEWKRFAQAVHVAARGAAAAPELHVAPQPQAAEPRPESGASTSSGWRGQRGQSGAAEQRSPLAYIEKCFRMYVDGKGRARRSEYGWWALFSVAALIIAMIVDMQFGVDYSGAPVNPVVTGAIVLALAAPGVSVTARRLHDISLNGWLAAAFVGVFVLGMAVSVEYDALGAATSLLFAVAAVAVGVVPSAPGPNQYGPNPKGAEAGV